MFLYIGNTANTLNSVEISHFGNERCSKAATSGRFRVSEVFFLNSEFASSDKQSAFELKITDMPDATALENRAHHQVVSAKVGPASRAILDALECSFPGHRAP